MWQALIGGIPGLIDTAIKRWGPAEKMSEAERAQLAQQMELAMLQRFGQELEAEYKDRADARALAAAESAKGNAFTTALSATVRPVWGFASLVVVAYPYLAGALGWPAVTIDDATKQIIQTVIMFYFGGKTIEKVLPLFRAGKP